MLVVDTNVIAYLYLPTRMTEAAEKVFRQDPDWAAPLLWRSELRSVLRAYIVKGLVDLNTALAIQEQAELMMRGREYSVQSSLVLTLASTSGCSAYDCEFIALARDLNTRLVTADKKLLQAFAQETQPLV